MLTMIRKVNSIYIPPLVSIWAMLCIVGILLMIANFNDWIYLGGLILFVLSKISLLIQVLTWVKEDENYE